MAVVPVVAVLGKRVGAVPGIRRVIVGTCGSPGSLVALRYAEFLARANDADLVPVLAWEAPGGDRGAKFQTPGELLREMKDKACGRLQGALTAVWGEVPADPRVQPHVERGPAGWVLVRVASQPGDILVVGTGRRGTPLLRGACCRVARYCAARAVCPVVLVPPAELAREAARRMRMRVFRRRMVIPARLVEE